MTASTPDPWRDRLRERIERRKRVAGPFLLFVLATTLALVAPLHLIPFVGIGGCVFLVLAKRWGGLTTPLLFVASLSVATFALHPLILHLGASVPWAQGFGIAAAASLRLGAVILVAAALEAWVPPAAWLDGLRRWPRAALVVALTIRMIPEFAAMQRRVRSAQRARGLVSWRDQVDALGTSFVLVLEQAERMARSL